MIFETIDGFFTTHAHVKSLNKIANSHIVDLAVVISATGRGMASERGVCF